DGVGVDGSEWSVEVRALEDRAERPRHGGHDAELVARWHGEVLADLDGVDVLVRAADGSDAGPVDVEPGWAALAVLGVHADAGVCEQEVDAGALAGVRDQHEVLLARLQGAEGRAVGAVEGAVGRDRERERGGARGRDAGWAGTDVTEVDGVPRGEHGLYQLV